MEPIGCTETSVKNYHFSLRNDPEERSSQCTVLIFEVFNDDDSEDSSLA